MVNARNRRALKIRKDIIINFLSPSVCVCGEAVYLFTIATSATGGFLIRSVPLTMIACSRRTHSTLPPAGNTVSSVCVSYTMMSYILYIVYCSDE